MDKVDETSHDINNLYNWTNSFVTSISFHQLILHIRSVLANLHGSLCYIKTVSTHTMDYIDAVIPGTLSPHLLPIMDLQKMLIHREETLPPMLHLPVSSDNTLHFYRYLHTHVLIANKQFLLLINVPIQDRSHQMTIYEIFTLDILHGNFTACYDITTKYLGITKDEAMAVELLSQQFLTCQTENGQFSPSYTFPVTSKPANLHFSFICQKFSKYFLKMLTTNKENIRPQHTISDSTKCLDFNYSTFYTSKHYHSDLPRKGYNIH